MASLSKDKDGTKRVLFQLGGQRRCLRLGRMPVKKAQTVKGHVQDLVWAAESNTSPNSDTAAWVADVGQDLFEKLLAFGLVAPRPEATDTVQEAGPTLGAFLAEYVALRIDLKGATKTVWGQVVRNLQEHFGPERELATIDEGAAEGFKMFLVGQGLAPTTIHKRLQVARGFFRAAIKRRLIASNPFIEVTAKAVIKSERFYFVTREEVERLLAVCDPTWRVIVALCRYGGLRCPSEVLSLRWQDVNWEASRIVVQSPKTEHHPGKGSRVIPLFPELRAILDEAWEAAPEGAEYVVGGDYRQAAMSPNGWLNCNLRTQFGRLLTRAGLKPWPRLFHALRASRETELAGEYPLHVVVGWLGNTPKIAMKHYLMATDADFEKATGGAAQNPAHFGDNPAQNPAQPTPAYAGQQSQETTQPLGKARGLFASGGPRRTVAGIISGGDRIRTCDLEVMSLASYRTAPPRVP